MRYLILSDIHANLEALEKCMEMAQAKYDQAVCLGDLVGYGPDPNGAIDRVRAITSQIIRGNHDKACCGLIDAEDFNPLAKIGTLWTRQELTPEHSEFLRDLPPGPATVQDFQFVHGSPADEDEYILGPSQALPALQNLARATVFFGHTHHQGGFMLTPAQRYQSIRFNPKEDGRAAILPLEEGGRYLINPGSVGQPRDGDCRAGFVIFDQEKHHIEYYRSSYNLSTTQAKMRAAGLPEQLVRRLELGR